MTEAWEFEYSIVTSASRRDAWAFWSDLRNHARMEGVQIELDGPFATGTKGRTIAPGFRQEWHLWDVHPRRRFVIVGEAPGFVLSFAWDFADEGTGTRLTQRISAEGAQLNDWADELRRMELNVPTAMARLAAELSRCGSAKP